MSLKPLKDYWNFIWKGDSLLSYIAFILTALFFLNFFLPFFFTITSNTIGLVDLLSVVSGSMIHGSFVEKGYYQYYEDKGFNRTEIYQFPFSNGINIGDAIVTWKEEPRNLKIGDVIIFNSGNIQIIHRIESIFKEEGIYYFTTKGDNNQGITSFDKRIHESRVVGKGVLKIPLIGYPRKLVNDLLNLARPN